MKTFEVHCVSSEKYPANRVIVWWVNSFCLVCKISPVFTATDIDKVLKGLNINLMKLVIILLMLFSYYSFCFSKALGVFGRLLFLFSLC